jgi:NAD(P)H-nitrite reductase large subunit
MNMTSEAPAGGKKKDLPEKGAIVQRDRQTYAIAPHLPGGLLDKETLLRYVGLFDRYPIQAMKITGAQRIAVIGFTEDQLDQVWSELGMTPGAAIGLCVRSVEMCPGTAFCKMGQQDSIGLGLELDRKYHGMSLPGKFKMAVAGCPMNCAAAPVRDVGVQGRPRAWRILVGGCLGPHPRFGQQLCEVESADEVLDVVDRVVTWFRENAKHRDRLGRLIERIGWETFYRAVMDAEPPRET